MPLEDWNATIGLNLTGSFLTARLAARRMMPRGNGAIVFISSILGVGGLAGRAAYSATKFGVIGMAKCMAIDFGPYGIRVNTVCPSPVEGPMLRAVYTQEGLEDQFLSRNPLGRLSEPEEQAHAILYLLSDYSSYINGAVLNVDGGMSAGYMNDLRRSTGADGEVRIPTIRQ
jgi:NAD(P)-dependent dehydrogenase (short-subunit alcohol dehydrogenase family)